MNRFSGKIVNFLEDKKYGFIRLGSQEETVFFHINDVRGNRGDIGIGVAATFALETTGTKRRATKVELFPARTKSSSVSERPVTQPYAGERFHFQKNEIDRFLTEISSWKLEAKHDDVDKYFFDIPELSSIESGSRCYIIGRKGTGKTAIAQHLSSRAGVERYVTKLSFKNFPFNELYRHENESYTRPNQYISLWKLIIYSFACRMLASDANVDPLVRRRITKAFPQVDSDNLSTQIGSWAAGDVGISILGTGFSLGKVFRKKNSYTISEKVENLEEFLLKNIGQSSFFVLFDELDEDYKDVAETYKRSEYIDLLTSLFKAIQDVKSKFPSSKYGLCPVAFLRDDIYDLLLDPDKNKWKDFELDLEWTAPTIRRMLSHRLSKVISKEERDFSKVWYSIFSDAPVAYADGRKSADSFTYMSRSTHGRPRDFIRYLQVCAEMQLRKQGGRISPEAIRDADKSYSNYLKDELVDEIHGLIPDISSIFSIMSQIRKWILDTEEFIDVYERQYSRGLMKTKDPNFILQTLFYFSVIGNVSRQGSHIFRLDNPDAKLNFTEKIVIHRGLTKSLQIL